MHPVHLIFLYFDAIKDKCVFEKSVIDSNTNNGIHHDNVNQEILYFATDIITIITTTSDSQITVTLYNMSFNTIRQFTIPTPKRVICANGKLLVWLNYDNDTTNNNINDNYKLCIFDTQNGKQLSYDRVYVDSHNITKTDINGEGYIVVCYRTTEGQFFFTTFTTFTMLKITMLKITKIKTVE